jgi:hypothetical protein
MFSIGHIREIWRLATAFQAMLLLLLSRARACCRLWRPRGEQTKTEAPNEDLSVQFTPAYEAVVLNNTQHAHPQYSIDCSPTEHLSEGTRNAP